MFSSQNVQTGSEGPPSPLFNVYQRPGREFDDSPPSGAEVKTEWSCTFTAPLLLHVVDRNKFTFAKQYNSFYKNVYFYITAPMLLMALSVYGIY
jgi:hypothetical protein